MRPTAICVLVTLSVGIAVAADPPTKGEIAKATKPAVAVLQINTTVTTATCVSPKGYFLSFAVNNLATGDAVSVVLNVGEKDEQSLPGKVLDVDRGSGFALVKADSPTPLAAVTFGDETKLTETDELLAFAPPHAAFSVPAPGKPAVALFRPVGASKVTVTTLAKKEGTIHSVVVTPRVDGLEGGPVMDLTGKAVGIQGGKVKDYTTSGVTPASVVRAFLARARITIDAPAVEPARRHDAVKVTATAFALPELTDDDAVELVVRSGGRERRVPMTRTKTGYEASVAPFEKADNPPVPVELRFPEGTVRGEVADHPFTVGGKPFTLGKVSGVRFGKAGGVSLPDGTTADGELKGLDELPVTVGGQTLALPTAAARDLTVRTTTELPGAFRLTAVVSRGGKVAGRAEVLRFVKGSEPHGIDGLKLGVFTKPPESDQPTTYAVFVGTDGSGRLAGKTIRFEGAEVKADAFSHPTQPVVSLTMKGQPSGPQRFEQPPYATFTLTPPGTEALQVKEYPKADGHGGVRIPDVAGVGLYADRTAVPVRTAKFVVWEYEADAKGVKKLAADVIASEANATGPVLVSVRFNSKYK